MKLLELLALGRAAGSAVGCRRCCSMPVACVEGPGSCIWFLGAPGFAAAEVASIPMRS